MINNNDRLNVMLLAAAYDVVQAVLRGEIYTKEPKHSVCLTMLANRVDEAYRTTTKEVRDDRSHLEKHPG